MQGTQASPRQQEQIDQVTQLRLDFKNLIIGPRSKKDIENNIEFFLITENGKTLKAKEVIKFKITPTIETNIIKLHF